MGTALRILNGGAFAVALYIVLTSPSNLKFLALLTLGLLALWFLWIKKHRWLSAILGAVALNAALYSGVLTSGLLWDSIAARVELTVNTLAMWLASPLWGHGLGSFNPLYPSYQEAHLSLFPGMSTMFSQDMAYFAGAAHNEIAQVLSEYGIVGFVLLCLALWSLMGKIRDALDLTAFVSLCLIGTISLVEFPFQNPHTGLLICVVVGLLANGRNVIRLSVPRIPAGVFAACLAGLIGVFTFKFWVAHQHFSYTLTFLARDPLVGVGHNLEAYNYFGWPRHIRHQLAISLVVAMGRDPTALEIDPNAADKMFAISEKAAGKASAIQIGRVEYLINSGRAGNHREEIDDRLAWMKRYARKQHVTWLMEAKWAVLTGDGPRAADALVMAQSMPNPMPGYTAQVNQLIAALR